MPDYQLKNPLEVKPCMMRHKIKRCHQRFIKYYRSGVECSCQCKAQEVQNRELAISSAVGAESSAWAESIGFEIANRSSADDDLDV